MIVQRDSVGNTPVILGPAYELHTGIHGGLFDSPPPGFSYSLQIGRRELVLPSEQSTVFDAQNLFEAASFGQGDEIVHSAGLPVLHRSAWVMDIDDIAALLFCSHYALNPQFGRTDARRATRSAAFQQHVALRVRNLLGSMAHDSCRALMVNTGWELKRVVDLIRTLAGQDMAERLQQKLSVILPAVSPIPRDTVIQKWSAPPDGLKWLFCGREFGPKRGAWALQAFRNIIQRSRDAECVYIGEVPETVRREFAGLSPRLCILESLPRADVLREMATAHVLFHPADNETLGAVILEAIAAAMCVVVLSGPGMWHISEWFSAGGAELIARETLSADAEQYALEQALDRVFRTPGMAKAHGLHNYAMASTGRFSLDARNALLSRVYGDCLTGQSSIGIDLSEVERPVGSVTLAMSGQELVERRLEYRRSIGLTQHSLEFSYEL